MKRKFRLAAQLSYDCSYLLLKKFFLSSKKYEKHIREFTLLDLLGRVKQGSR